eukprot:CAMPEP_0172437988 /NCGR_PEP_ID=MMETSP1064-20121228/72558_1 /TAXON_ID=202472 /ORGANISM="Aulacoseira subarctica , Strain CCAP 1002/5" /LENGTH=41 /DNA_ID= /DNA_START= /DNA_END= /DNA_ORIENTATION=
MLDIDEEDEDLYDLIILRLVRSFHYCERFDQIERHLRDNIA